MGAVSSAPDGPDDAPDGDDAAPDGHDQRIAAMFDRIASRYDLLNRVLSLGRDRGWRRRAIALAGEGAWRTALDVGSGTGDLAFGLLAARPDARVLGVDIAAAMLQVALRRAARDPRASRARFAVANAMRLPLADASVERIVSGFTVRNVGDLPAALRDMRRVLAPGGRAVILELATPRAPLVGLLYRVYSRWVLPRIAAAFGSDPEAYRYLPASIARFATPEALAAALREANFMRVRVERLTFGIATIHVAEA